MLHPNLADLKKLHQQYQNRSLVVLGFTCNDFNQEGKNDKEIANVCYINYGVTFDMFGPVALTGPDAHALFRALAAQSSAPRAATLISIWPTQKARWSNTSTAMNLKKSVELIPAKNMQHKLDRQMKIMWCI